MKVTDLTKICHAIAGDIIQLVDENFRPLDGYYLVCVEGDPDYKKRGRSMSGLYELKGTMFLVNLETGLKLDKTPHLSSKHIIVRNAELLINDEEKEDKHV